MPAMLEVRPHTQSAAGLVWPLAEFYRLRELPLPSLETLDGPALPEPFRALLAHPRDMTPTLERFHKGRLHLAVLDRFLRGEYYHRLVALCLDKQGSPVEFGANCINLNHFPCTARRLISEEYVPLGTILADFDLVHFNEPQAYFRIEADALIQGALRLAGPRLLYGRRNRMTDAHGRVLSEVVEILPPLDCATG